MLVLSRERGERVKLVDQATGRVIGTVTLCDIRGNAVRIGFHFDDSVRILREELTPEKLAPAA